PQQLSPLIKEHRWTNARNPLSRVYLTLTISMKPYSVPSLVHDMPSPWALFRHPHGLAHRLLENYLKPLLKIYSLSSLKI
ncbi:hypothetical protein Csa_004602, partial [Cucumis sativus]